MISKVRQLLKTNKPTIGTHCDCTWPSIWEAIGRTGMVDYIEFCSQYGAWDLWSFDNMARAVELTNTDAWIKIDRNPKDWIAQRAIAAGFTGILFADLMSAKEVKEAVEAVRLPPVGVNGSMGTRGFRPEGDYIEHLENIVIAIMIEKKSLMNDLENVLAVDGVDMIQFGPSDYSLSLRTPRQPFNRKEAMEKTIADRDKSTEMAIKAGVRPRAEAGDAAGCEAFIKQGIRDFCIGWDLNIVRAFAMNEGKKLRGTLGLPIPEPRSGSPAT